MKKLFSNIFIVIISLQGCSQTNKDSTKTNVTNEIKSPMIKEVLKYQLEDGESNPLGDEYESHDYSERDLEATIPIVENILKSQGYKFPSQSEFNEKIKLKLNRIIDYKSDKKYLYVNLFDKCSREIFYSRNPVYNGVFIIKNNFFITDLYALPELIDYQKEFPELKYIEDNKIIKQEPDLGQDIEIPHWKDIEDLPKQRRFNQLLLISRNKYLFNDDKSRFVWLIHNDEYFMRSLVTVFGYTEDKKLLKWVFENTSLPNFSKYAEIKYLQEFSKLLWTKQCNGEVKVHQNTLDLIKELSTSEENLYIMYVADYLSNYIAERSFEQNEDLNIAQKAKVVAHLLYFGEQYKYDKAYDYNQMFMTRFYNYNYQRKEFEKEFIKNNYYDLPKFKEWYETAKKEKDKFEGWEMEDDPQPENYKNFANPIQ